MLLAGLLWNFGGFNSVRVPPFLSGVVIGVSNLERPSDRGPGTGLCEASYEWVLVVSLASLDIPLWNQGPRTRMQSVLPHANAMDRVGPLLTEDRIN